MSKAPTWWKWFPWILALIVLEAGKIIWYQSSGKNFPPPDLYGWFPILGIWAFSLMWTHYAVGEARRINPKLPKNELYSKVTGFLVLALILLHPGLLAIAQYQNGFGLPPASAYTYVGEPGKLAISLALIALCLFLGYDIVEKFKNKPSVQKKWWLVNITQSIAMLFILKHSFTIGSHVLQPGWFRAYWIVLGTLLLPMIVHVHWDDFRNRKK